MRILHKPDNNISKGKMLKRIESLNRRKVIKNIFFSFVITLPVFNTIFKVFGGREKGRKPTSQELFKNHNLAG